MNIFSQFINRAHEIYFPQRLRADFGIECTASEEMHNALLVWQDIYENKAPWLTGEMKSLSLGSAIAAEFARLVTLELKSAAASEDARGKYINGVYESFIAKNLRNAVERACALGGVCFKPYISNGKMIIDAADPFDFYPTEYDDEYRVTGGIFLARKLIGNKRYTKAELHRFADGAENVRSLCYCASGGMSGLGGRVSLSEVSEWSQIQEEFTVSGIDRPLFCYFKMPFANHVDRQSPLGVSVYSRALELLRDADEQYTRLLWEFEGGELAVHADDTMLKNNKLPAHKKRVFKKLMLGLNGNSEDFYNVFSPVLRDESIARGLNIILRRIEFSSSLAYGTLSDVNDVDKTAEEIRSSKQRSYAAVRDIQNALEGALRDLAYIIGVWGGIYGLCPNGGELDMTFEWDDSIIADRQQEFTEKSQLVRDGIMQPWELRMWYFGEDEQTAKSRAVLDDLEGYDE